MGKKFLTGKGPPVPHSSKKAHFEITKEDKYFMTLNRALLINHLIGHFHILHFLSTYCEVLKI